MSEVKGESLRILREFRSSTCRCGKPKRQQHSFCRTCYFTLPEPIRRALYKKFGEGYESAYEDACQVLEEHSPEGEEATQESTAHRPHWEQDDIPF